MSTPGRRSNILGFPQGFAAQVLVIFQPDCSTRGYLQSPFRNLSTRKKTVVRMVKTCRSYTFDGAYFCDESEQHCH